MTSSPSRDPHRLALLTILVIALIARLVLWGGARALEEDFYITLRYAENIAQGNGFVYNIGERVLGTTTPLYTLFLALFLKLGLPAVPIAQGVGILADLLAIVFAYRFGKACDKPTAGSIAGLLLAIAPTNLVWASKGMETGIVALFGIAMWVYWLEKKEIASWLCAATLVLLRIDGVAGAVVLASATLFRDKRLPSRGIAVFSLALLPWLLFAFTYFGSPIPTSLKAKLVVYAWHAPSRFPNIVPFLRLMLGNPLGILLGAGTLAFFASLAEATRRHNSERLMLLFPLAAIGIHYAGMAFSKVFLFGWYFVPPTPLTYLFAALGGHFLVEKTHIKAPNRLPLWAMFALIGIVLGGVTVPRVLRVLREGQAVETNVRIPIGKWLKQNAAPTDTVMLEPIGYIGYISGLRVLDTVGLVSPEVLPYYKDKIDAPYHEIWRRFLPRWILLRTGEEQDLREYEKHLEPSSRLDAAYRRREVWGAASPTMPPAFTLYERR